MAAHGAGSRLPVRSLSAAACDRDGRLAGVSPVVTLFGWILEELQSVRTLDLVLPVGRARAEAASGGRW